MADDAPQAEQGGGGGSSSVAPIIIKKKKKGADHGHHGGAWKVAYADFVTAMMAFFLLLWLLSSTTEEQKSGIAHYFNPPNNSTEYGGGDGIMGGTSAVEAPEHAPAEAPELPKAQTDSLALKATEDELFKEMSQKIQDAMMNIPELRALMDNLMVDITPEGLRIQLVDKEGRPLFVGRTAKLQDYTERMLAVIANVLAPLPHKLAVGGYTDAVPSAPGAEVTNWELSADRAQSARRTLMSEGILESRVGRVSGYAAQDLLYADRPGDMRNNRLALIVLRANQGVINRFSQNGLIEPQGGSW